MELIESKEQKVKKFPPFLLLQIEPCSRFFLTKGGIKMIKENDSRINVRHTPIKEYGFLFLVVFFFSGIHWIIYEALVQSGLIESNTILSVHILLVYVLGTSALITVSIYIIRERTFIRPIRILAEAA